MQKKEEWNKAALIPSVNITEVMKKADSGVFNFPLILSYTKNKELNPCTHLK